MGESDIDLAIKTSRRLEGLLETRYGAEGRGLHEKLASVEAMLSPEALRDGRYVATMRNKVVHEDGFSLPDRPRFMNCAAAFEKEVGGGRRLTSGERLPWGALICLGGFVLLGAWPVLGPALVPVKRNGLEGLGVVVMYGMAAYLMILIPPRLWLRERLKGRRAGWLLIILVGLLLIPYYILSELGRYVAGRLRGTA